MTSPLRIGVIGLGQSWRQHYRPALSALGERFQVHAVCDQVQVGAEEEAARLGCTAALGPTALLVNKEIQALLLIDPQWYGLWPVEVACRLGKPVYCAASPQREGAGAAALVDRVTSAGVPVVVALALRWSLAAEKLRQLLAGQLGPPRLLVAEVVLAPENHTGPEWDLALLDWCISLLGGEPEKALAWRGAADHSGRVFDFGEGRTALIHRRTAPATPTSWRLHVVAENGSATVDRPDRLSWSADDGQHRQRLLGPSPTHLLLERFHEGLTAGQPAGTSLAEAARLVGWLQAGSEAP